MGPEDPARRPDVAELRGEAEQPQAKPEEDVIIDHGADPPAHRLNHDKPEVTAPLVIGGQAPRCRENSGTAHVSGRFP